MKIAACYIRVSTDDQTELSPESQLIEIKKYAAEHSFYIPDEYIFRDEGISGRTTSKRPAFNEMITAAKKKPKPFEAVLLWKFSRFARNRTDAVVYKNMLRSQCGIDVISISENIGEDRGTSVILEAMFEAMDEYYSINLSTEVKRSMKVKAEKGEPLGPAPFGYRNEDKAYVVAPDEAKIVKYIFSQYENGYPIKRIATDLNRLGVITKRGNPLDNRFIEYVLRNPTYCGKIRWNDNGRENNKTRYRYSNGNVTQGKHEPIISEEQFEKVQKLLEEQKKKYGPYQRPQNSNAYMLRGLVRCSNCNSTLILINRKHIPAYQCHSYSRGSCNVSHHITEKKLNDTVITALKTAVETLNFDIHPSSTQKDEDTFTIQKMLESEKRKMFKIKEAYEKGIDSLEEYAENKKRITSAIEELETQLKTKNISFNKQNYSLKIKNVIAYIEDPTVTDAEKNDVLRTIIQNIIFDRRSGRIEVIFHE